MNNEFVELAGIRYRPHSLVESDAVMVDFFRWIADLPDYRSADGDETTLARKDGPAVMRTVGLLTLLLLQAALSRGPGPDALE